jgi:hypothetical protein
MPAHNDPLHGEHEVTEPADDRVVTAGANKQRYEAQKDEPADYPGDSGKQAKALLDEQDDPQDKIAKEKTKEADAGTKQAPTPANKQAAKPDGNK